LLLVYLIVFEGWEWAMREGELEKLAGGGGL
jgi:hypothetical protein